MSSAVRSGAVAPGLAEEFPGLSLRYTVVEAGGRSDRALKERLRVLSNRIGGAQAVNLRHQPIPWAYRVFYRHIGLDPDEQPTPVEGLVLERMRRGGFASQGRLADALTVATVESGVALVAFDAESVVGELSIRPSVPGEALAGRPGELPQGTLVIADELRPIALLFGTIAAGFEPGRRTARALVVALGVGGVPQIAVEEALWLVTEVLAPAG